MAYSSMFYSLLASVLSLRRLRAWLWFEPFFRYLTPRMPTPVAMLAASALMIRAVSDMI